MKYRKIPLVIDATQYTEDVIDRIVHGMDDCPDKMTIGRWQEETDSGKIWERGIFIETLGGKMKVSPGDWIITGVNGEIYPCKPDIFEMTYEPA